jgi:ribosomal protein S18 acetylase RimI-like enzyme
MESLSIPDNFYTDLERQEMEYWSDYYRAAGPEVTKNCDLQIRKIGSGIATAAGKIDILAFNRVIGLGLTEPVMEEQLKDIIRFYRPTGIPRIFVQLSPKVVTNDLSGLLDKHGLQHYNNWTKLYREVNPIPQAESSLRIEQIGEDRADLFARIIISSFEWPLMVKPMVALPVGRKGWKHYLAYQGSEPVACAACFIKGKYASLAFAATLPDYRGLGAQSSLIARRFQDAAEAGCEWMVVETAEDKPERPVTSYRNLKQLGFELAYLRPNYIYYFERT